MALSGQQDSVGRRAWGAPFRDLEVGHPGLESGALLRDHDPPVGGRAEPTALLPGCAVTLPGLGSW